MPPKRKAPGDENPNVTVGRSKIRRRASGKRIVDEELRKNVLLFLENLTDGEAKDSSQPTFQSKLNWAVAGAMDPVTGPEAYIDLSKYHPKFPEAFGNKQAGQLMTTLLGMNDDERLAELQKVFDEQKKKLQEEQTNKEKVEKALAYLQDLIPLSQAGKKDLARELEALESPGDDSGWLYGILWTSCLQWMDTRLRQLRAFRINTGIQTLKTEQAGLPERTRIINARLHGGDLRSDAVLCSIKFGDHRHNNVHYDTYLRNAFESMYGGLKVEEGLWLARNGLTVAGGVDWPAMIGFIDKFVATADRVATWDQKRPEKYEEVINTDFSALTKHVSHLISQAKATPDWKISAEDLKLLDQHRNHLLQECRKWKHNKETQPVWDIMGREPVAWAHAGYLRDEMTKRSRIVAQGAGTMKLRPKARIRYTP